MQSTVNPIPNLTVDPAAKAFNALLRLELAAAATYESAQAHNDDPELRVVLEQNRLSHADRAATLGKLVSQRGMAPSQGGGPWLALSKAAEAGASLLGADALIKVLIEGEKALLNRLTSAGSELGHTARTLVNENLVPEQSACLKRLERVQAS